MRNQRYCFDGGRLHGTTEDPRDSLVFFYLPTEELAYTAKVEDPLLKLETFPQCSSSGEIDKAVAELKPEVRKDREKHIGMLHHRGGHTAFVEMAQAFRQRGAHPVAVRLLEEYRCDACAQSALPVPKPLAVMKAIPEEWKVVESDLFEWGKPTNLQDKHKCIIFVDAGSRMKAGKYVFHLHKARNATATECLTAWYEKWVS